MNYLKKEESETWVYEYSLWKNPTIFMTIWKVFLISSLAPALVVFFTSLEDGFITASVSFLKIFGIVIGIITILLLIAYVIYCLINNGKYIIIFEVDNDGIKHTQMEKQFNKIQAMALLGTTIGTLNNSLVTIGSNLIAGSRNSIYTQFKKVKKIKCLKKKNTIKLLSNGYNNQIYIDNEHYDEILNYIISKCPKNTIIK